MDTQSDAVKAIDATFDRAMAQLNEALAIARQALEQRDEARAQVKELRAALSAMLCYGDSLAPDLRADAKIQARAALSKAGA